MKAVPQFTFEQLYQPPFERRRSETTDMGPVYLKIDKKPTGVKLLDEFVAYISAGHTHHKAFCVERGIRMAYLTGYIVLLTGMSPDELSRRFSLRMAEQLLLHTDLSPAEVAARSGIGSAVNLFYVFKRAHNTSPVEWRRRNRKPGDVGEYR